MCCRCHSTALYLLPKSFGGQNKGGSRRRKLQIVTAKRSLTRSVYVKTCFSLSFSFPNCHSTHLQLESRCYTYTLYRLQEYWTTIHILQLPTFWNGAIKGTLVSLFMLIQGFKTNCAEFVAGSKSEKWFAKVCQGQTFWVIEWNQNCLVWTRHVIGKVGSNLGRKGGQRPLCTAVINDDAFHSPSSSMCVCVLFMYVHVCV